MSGLFKPMVSGPARHVQRLAADPEYRTLARLESALGRLPRATPCRARVHGWNLEIPDAASFLSSYREIFVDRRHAFPWPGPAPPRILDLGANIGLSVLFFKHLHPRARILALEADPGMFRILERNLRGNGFDDVERIARAAWNADTRLPFAPDGADGGRVALSGPAPLEVAAVDLGALLRGRDFDFVKVDVEGAEDVVLPACRETLQRARYLAVEYHSIPGRRQSLADLLRLMEECGFRVHVHSVISSPTPFVEVRPHAGFDLQLHLFGWKP